MKVSSPGTWLADLGPSEGMPCVLGHALDLTASHGGKAKHAKIAAQKIAVLRRGGRRPPADVYPAEMRAPRDLLRRRLHRTRQRAALLPPVQPTTWPSTRPALGQKSASQANRQGGAARCPEPAGHKRVDVDLAFIDVSDP